MARRRLPLRGAIGRRRHGGKRRFTIPVAVVGGFAPLVLNVLRTQGGWDRKLWMLTEATTGYDTDTQKWWAPNLNKGMTWILLGAAIHLIANKVGINRALSGVPFIRI